MAGTPQPVFRSRSALRSLLLDVRAYFKAHVAVGCPDAQVLYGRRELAKQTNQGPDGANRVVFAPPDDGKTGAYARTSKPGNWRAIPDPENPTQTIGRTRALFDWDRLLIVSVWAHDPANAEDELAQQDAAEDLFEWLCRAMQASAFGAANVKLGKASEVIVPVERKFGCEFRAEVTLQAPVLDLPEGVAYPLAAPIGASSSLPNSPTKHPAS